MNRTPSMRPHAEKVNQHHMFWRSKEWRNNSVASARLRLMNAFIVPVVRATHDHLHSTIEPLTPPPQEVCDTVYEIGLNEPYDKPLIRVANIIDSVAHEAAHEISPLRSDYLMSVAYHLVSQTAILELGVTDE